MESLTANLTGKVRRVTRNGREYLVAPLTLLSEGTLKGSKGRLYYPFSEISQGASQWDDTPLVAYHPTDNQGNHISGRHPSVLDSKKVGRVYNTVASNGKLKAEGWFDVERTRSVDPRILDSLESGRPMELSTGLFTRNERARPGSIDSRGREYDYIARGHVADHVAVLPDQRGACSIDDGCGINVNRDFSVHTYALSSAWTPVENKRIVPKTAREWSSIAVANVFCPTGSGGGIDPSCSPGGKKKEGSKWTDKLKKAFYALHPRTWTSGHRKGTTETGEKAKARHKELDDREKTDAKSGKRGGGEGDRGKPEEDRRGMEKEAKRSAGKESDTEGNPKAKPSSDGPTDSVPSRGENKKEVEAANKAAAATLEEVNKRLDRYSKFFASKGNTHVAEWLGELKNHVNLLGPEAALAALGEAVGDKGKSSGDGTVQYWGVGTDEANWKHMGDFMEKYLARNGITAVTGEESSSDSPLISALGKPDRYLSGDFKPVNDAFKNKLEESQHLPGLEKSEDLSKLMGKDTTHLTKEVTDKLDTEYGKGKWIVKAYGDDAAAGFGIFFPQRAAKIQEEAKNTLWQAGGELGKYGFSHLRDDGGKVVGIKHTSGDEYKFGTDKYSNTIHGDARTWGDRSATAAESENGAVLPLGGKEFMAQPAFDAVGISDAERAAGKTWHEKNEGRVHLVTRPNGNVEVIPHSTWLKGGSLPVVFDDDDTRAMAKAARDTIAALPEKARKGQVYAPDVMKTKDGYKVVELNAQGDYNGSGYLHDNHFTIDSYVSHLTGKEPAHVKFIRSLLSSRKGKSPTGNSNSEWETVGNFDESQVKRDDTGKFTHQDGRSPSKAGSSSTDGKKKETDDEWRAKAKERLSTLQGNISNLKEEIQSAIEHNEKEALAEFRKHLSLAKTKARSLREDLDADRSERRLGKDMNLKEVLRKGPTDNSTHTSYKSVSVGISNIKRSMSRGYTFPQRNRGKSWIGVSNALPNQPRSLVSGKYKIPNAGTGKGEAHESAQRGSLNLTSEDEELGADALAQLQATGDNPASWVEDEGKWEKAKEAANKGDYGGEDSDKYWAVVTAIYKKMGGKIKDNPTTNKWSVAARQAALASRMSHAGKGNKATASTKSADANKASKAANTVNKSGSGSTKDSVAAHKNAATAHEDAARAHEQAGNKRMSQGHKDLAKKHSEIADLYSSLSDSPDDSGGDEEEDASEDPDYVYNAFDESKIKRAPDGRFGTKPGEHDGPKQTDRVGGRKASQDTAPPTATPATQPEGKNWIDSGDTSSIAARTAMAALGELSFGIAPTALKAVVPGLKTKEDKEQYAEVAQVFKGIFSRMTLGTGPLLVKGIGAGVRVSPVAFRLLAKMIRAGATGAIAAGKAVAEAIPSKGGRTSKKGFSNPFGPHVKNEPPTGNRDKKDYWTPVVVNRVFDEKKFKRDSSGKFASKEIIISPRSREPSTPTSARSSVQDGEDTLGELGRVIKESVTDFGEELKGVYNDLFKDLLSTLTFGIGTTTLAIAIPGLRTHKDQARIDDTVDFFKALFSRLTLGAGPLVAKGIAAGVKHSPKAFRLLVRMAKTMTPTKALDTSKARTNFGGSRPAAIPTTNSESSLVVNAATPTKKGPSDPREAVFDKAKADLMAFLEANPEEVDNLVEACKAALQAMGGKGNTPPVPTPAAPSLPNNPAPVPAGAIPPKKTPPAMNRLEGKWETIARV